MKLSVFPTAAIRGIPGIRSVGPRTVGSLSQLFPSASAVLALHDLFCSHRSPGAS